jgi:hypothetical protein
MKISMPRRAAGRVEPIPKLYKPWLILSLVILIGSLGLFAVAVTAAFVSFGDEKTPLWVIVLGCLSVLGIGLGFGGFFLLMAMAGFQAWREGRKVRILPPEEPASDPTKV